MKAAEIADSIGLRGCAQNIRAALPQLKRGMLRYNNPYSNYLSRRTTGC